MYFSRITFNPLVDHQQLAKTLCEDGYREHQALWKLFDTDPDAKRDFLYRQVIEHGRIKYYLLSDRTPIDKTGIWCIDTPKMYNPNLSGGQKLFFMLRTNPIITVSTPDGKKQRHDVVMHEKKRIGYKQMPKKERPLLQKLVQDSCIKWLDVRAPGKGFSLEIGTVIADGYQQHQSRAKNQKQSIRYSTVDFQGVLTIADPELFRSTLFSGIGKSKAFGCGLMLVRRT
jgi:CRISPR system Cascade subunit CasE